MSTRSITTVRSKWGGKDEWCDHTHIYRHHDGYLEGHGAWLHEFLNGLEVINGIPRDPPSRFANGPGRLAAQMVAALQSDDHEPDLCGDAGPRGQEYHYVVSVEFGMDGGTVSVTVYDGPMTFFGHGGDQCTNEVFSGSVEEYGRFIDSPNKEVSGERSTSAGLTGYHGG